MLIKAKESNAGRLTLSPQHNMTLSGTDTFAASDLIRTALAITAAATVQMMPLMYLPRPYRPAMSHASGLA